MSKGELLFATATETITADPIMAAVAEQSDTTRTNSVPSTMTTKKIFDFVMAVLLLIFFAPVLLILMALVKIDGGPAFFGHKRIGQDGKTFRCWKFRSMVTNADEVLKRVLETDPDARAEWARDFKLRNDPRVTPIGRFLRKSSLDELPQIFNVLTGEMSLVGPRPIVTAEIDRYGTAFIDYMACRPGITGLWQVSGRNDVDYASRVAFDQRYAQTWSFARDVNILFRTVIVVARRSGAY
jgi:undecaprenyl-phosphate galactose phosphotransferase